MITTTALPLCGHCGKACYASIAFCPYCGLSPGADGATARRPRRRCDAVNPTLPTSVQQDVRPDGSAILPERTVETVLAVNSPPIQPASVSSQASLQERPTRFKAVLLLSLIVFLGAAVFIWDGGMRGSDPDHCPTNVERNATIVIDFRQPLRHYTADEVINRVTQFVRYQVKPNERISLFDLSSGGNGELMPTISACKLVAWRTWLARATGANKEAIEERVIRAVRKALAEPRTTGANPLTRVVTDLSLSRYLRATSNTLVIFSDLVEQTPAFSLLACASSETVVRLFSESRHGVMVRPNFFDTKISVNVIPRPDLTGPVDACRKRLWNWFLGDSNGTDSEVQFDYLPTGISSGLIPQDLTK